ncbi:acyltransferase family protein [Evansella tamaricis]|uniref:Acyltransferase family protein n=1 Tax=Evansella tamaricis TaxID=2069301 RepID=A0ABS6JF83_9BACI|nr:acyltransferase family protein [Evansella tamaricis]MBU9712173.1 acyltransferase family protein [Evansella tamaricis]
MKNSIVQQKNRPIISELVILRFVACLAVVMIHAIETSLENYTGELSTIETLFYHTIRMAMMFGTPTFVFLSELLLAKSYQGDLPANFLSTRAKYLLLPYLSMAVVYGVIFHANESLNAVFIAVLKNIFLADFTVYFVLIIFQFYLLHFFLHSYLKTWNRNIVLITSLIINLLYLAFFNFVPPISFIPNVDFLWYHLSWLPFPGWLFYFTLGYYCGRHYHEFKMILSKFQKLVFFIPIPVFLLVLILSYTQIIGVVSSKRIDIIFYTTTMIFLLIYLSSSVKHLHPIIVKISNYSFGIYLLHKIFMYYLKPMPILNSYGFTLYVFITSIILSMIVIYFVNKLSFGKYIVGRINTISISNVNGEKTRKKSEIS